MRIEKTGFGKLVLGGRSYTSDLIIYPDGRVVEGWRRGRGHRLTLEDISDLVDSGPDVIVAGTGVFGLMAPEPGLEERLLRLGIVFLPAKNRRAAEIFNQRAGSGRAGACFHLTC
jgi:hypothetical protein